MTGSALAKRNKRMLSEIHPSIRGKVAAVLQDLRGHGFRPRIQQAHRSEAEQTANVAAGASKVTWSYHMASGPNGEPEALAADILDDDNPLGEDRDRERRFYLMLASSAWAHELNTGTLWGLSAKERAAVRTAVRQKNWDAKLGLGWDAGHVEVKGISLARARRGERPDVA